MGKTRNQWMQKKSAVLPAEFDQLIKAEGLSELLGGLLWQRGIHTKEELRKYFSPELTDLYDPFLMHDMEKAVERIQEAVIEGQKILIYGDYDADGITSTTIMMETLETLGADVQFAIPNRFQHGYGPNQALFEEKIAAGIQLIITVDNGVSGHEAIKAAQALGVDVIVTDHHELPAQLPDAYAIVHPRHPEGHYPFGDLAGVGVAFKVATALLEEVPIEFLDVAAIGTIADLVSLTDENRTIVKLGLAAIKKGSRLGLNELLKVSGIKLQDVTEMSIGFGVAPRLNAAGRLYDAAPGVFLLKSFDEEEAVRLSTELNTVNDERKGLVESITAEALSMLNQENEIHVLVHSGWHEGVLGIVAGNVLKKTGKPAIVLTQKENGECKGSGRSHDGINLFEMLDSMRQLFLRFGGHHAAVGLTISAENIPLFQADMNRYIRELGEEAARGGAIMVDQELPLSEAALPLIEAIDRLAPFGTDNPKPKFSFTDYQADQLRQIGSEKQHLKFMLRNENNELDVIAFGFGESYEELIAGKNNFVGTLAINEWNGQKKPQLLLEDYQSDSLQVIDRRAKHTWNQPIDGSAATLFACFDEKNLKKFQGQLPGEVVFIKDRQTAEIAIAQQHYQQLAVVDCPKSKEQLLEIIKAGSFQRIYLMLYSSEEAYMNGLGSREQYGKLYNFVQKHENIDVRHKTKQIATFLSIPEKLLIFMIRVFFELKFVTIENGVLRGVAEPENHPLTDSRLYCQRVEQIKAEEFLLLSDIATIKEWLLNEEEPI